MKQEYDYEKMKEVLEQELQKAFEAEGIGSNKDYFEPIKQSEINSLEDVMKKMLFHAQNGTGKNGINFKEDIQSNEDIFCQFNPQDFLNSYKTYEEWESCAKEEIKEKGWNGYLKTVYGVAKYLEQFNSVEEFKDKINSSNAKELIEEIEGILGFGPALTRDFLKECGRTDLVKPDTHIKQFFQELFFKNYKNINTEKFAQKIDEKAQEICEQFGEDWTPYKLDKYIYLICSHNFYLDGVNNNYRQRLIAQIEKEWGKNK